MESTLNILCIEDSEADFLLTKRYLLQQGLDATCTRIDSTEALEQALDKDRWDLVLSDFSVPQYNFYDGFSRIKASNPDLPVILVSGSVGEEQAIELLTLGIWDFVLKENLARLIPAIERCVTESKSRKARWEAEEKLRNSEVRYKSIFNNSPIAIGINRKDNGLFIDVNDALIRILGFNRNELIGRTIDELNVYTRAEERAEILRILDECGQVINREVKLRTKTGELITVLFSAELLELDNEVFLQVMLTDITELKRLESVSLQKETMYHSLFKNMTKGFAHCQVLFEVAGVSETA